MNRDYTEHPKDIYGAITMEDKRVVDQGIRRYESRRRNCERILLHGAKQGSEACVGELHRMGLTLWWRPEGTIMDRRER